VFRWLGRAANPPLFAVVVADGVARLAQGTATAAWIADCTTIAREFSIDRGHIEAVRTWRGVVLRFSPEVPVASRQRFRNVFALHRSHRS
jgi:hypothetical protein